MPSTEDLPAEIFETTTSLEPVNSASSVHRRTSRQLTQVTANVVRDEAAGGEVARWRAWSLLFIFSATQMLDIFNVTAPTVALPDIAADIGVTFAERQWVINAYSLTFGAFLLTGGRFSAIYGPKYLFVGGFAWVGICGIINGFAVNGPMLFVFRAFQGVGAAMTIPSALSMITQLFPSRGDQDKALGIFAGFGAMGSVCGLVLGGVISQLLTWRWIFWILSMVVIPLSLIAFLLAPNFKTESSSTSTLKNMDWLGLCTITLSLILFIYSVTEGNNRGWATGGILAPLIISIFLLPVFGFIETKVADPLIPPAVWTLPEFVPMFFITLSEYLTMNVVIYQESLVFQQVWGTTPLSAALRIIPFGITGFMVTIAMGWVTPHVAPRWILVGGQLLMLTGSVLVACADVQSKYWRMVLPALIVTALGVSSGFVAANIAMLRTPLAKPSLKLSDSTALIGAIFNADLQIGSTVGLAIATAITSRVNGTNNADFAGYRASYWFLVGITAFEAILAAVALRSRLVIPSESEESTMMPTTSEEKKEEKV